MWFCPSSHQHFADKCNCVTQSTYVHAHPSFQVLMCTHELHVTVILPACARLKTPCVIFAQRVWSMQHPSAANEEQALVTGQLCVYSPSPVLSWGRCHASSLIDSQISMSLYDTRGPAVVMNISTLTGFVGQPVFSYGCSSTYSTCACVQQVEQRSHRNLYIYVERNIDNR